MGNHILLFLLGIEGLFFNNFLEGEGPYLHHIIHFL
jgi:hypothetical protein